MNKYDGYALITGGSNGIGLEFARKLAAEGYNLVLVARDVTRLSEAAAELKQKYSVDVVILSQDLSKPESTDIIYKQLQEKQIHVGLLVNNAGFGNHQDYFHKINQNIQVDMINLMCLGYMNLTYKFLPAMLEKKSGGIILISSLAALFPVPLNTIYSASKAFVLKLGINLHAEYGGKGIDILTVCPAYTDTNLFAASNEIPPPIAMLTSEEVVRKSLNALGKDIVLVLKNKQFQQRFLTFLANFLSDKTKEKLVKKYLKDTRNLHL
jgi:short-subunit dehydrogenase